LAIGSDLLYLQSQREIDSASLAHPDVKSGGSPKVNNTNKKQGRLAQLISEHPDVKSGGSPKVNNTNKKQGRL